MQFIKPGVNINFVGNKNIAFILSMVMVVVSIFSLALKNGPKYGVDFAGGTLIQVKFHSPANIDDIKKGLADINIGKSSTQAFGDQKDNEFLIRTDKSVATTEGFSDNLEKALRSATGNDVEIRRIEMVGPQVGKDLREKALFAMFYALLFITVYISGRFELKWAVSAAMAIVLIGLVFLIIKAGDIFSIQTSIPFLIISALIVTLMLFWFFDLKYAMGAIVALIHDITITVGVFSIFNKEFTLPIIAALLTIIGYSLNDTIIVFDRIRENLKKYRKDTLDILINKSINETLGRTILTSTTTLVVVVSLFILGGGIIHDFAFALIVGILVGTYSSIYIASPILIVWQKYGKNN